MTKDIGLKVLGALAVAVSLGANLLAGFVDDKKRDVLIEKKVREAVEKLALAKTDD